MYREPGVKYDDEVEHKSGPSQRDEEIERYLNGGQYDSALEYAREMKTIAGEMDDSTGLEKYSRYEKKILNLMDDRKPRGRLGRI
jgi:hypothetical protein